MSFFQRIASLFAPAKPDAAPRPVSRQGGAYPPHDLEDPVARARLLESIAEQGLEACHPDNDTFSMLLGNMLRMQGDIDLALKLREAALARPALTRQGKARVYFEMGADYRQAGLFDRAQMAYSEARRLGFDPAILGRELSLLYADAGDFAAAAEERAALGDSGAQAYFLVRQAEESAGPGKDRMAMSLLKKALRVSPGCPEAWWRMAGMHLLGGEAPKAALNIRSGLKRTDEAGRLIVLENLRALIRGPHAPNIPPRVAQAFAEELSELLDDYATEIIPCYYAGIFWLAAGEHARAEGWFTKSLVLDPEFWASRLAILELAARRESLPLLLSRQIDFFVSLGTKARRFVCRVCGLRRDTVFSFCPRCRSWHSVAFRTRIT